MWLARCAHVARLPPPRRFRELMDAVPPIPSCHDYLLATGRFAGEFWILSHPAVVAADVLPLDTNSGAPITYAYAYADQPQPDDWQPSLARFPRPRMTAGLLLHSGYVASALCSSVSYRMNQYRAAFGPAAAAAGTGRFPADGLHCAWLRLAAAALIASGWPNQATLVRPLRHYFDDALFWLPRTCPLGGQGPTAGNQSGSARPTG